MMLRKDHAKKAASVLAMGALLCPTSLLLARSSQTADSTALAAQSTFTMKVNTDIVLVSVTARDKQGNLVRDLKESDFTVVEDGKPQKLRSFDVEDAQTYATNGPAQSETQATAPTQVLAAQKIEPEALRDRRLVVLFFDLGSMEQEEVQRAADSARKYIDTQMSPADLVAMVTFDTSLQ